MTPQRTPRAKWHRLTLLGALVACALTSSARAKEPTGPAILMVADERPAMEVLAKQLGTRAHANATIVKPDALPATLGSFQDVLVYIHKDLSETAEKAFLSYADGGGHLVLLHHSISSGKRKNKDWFPALGIALPTGDFATGGYKYVEDARWDIYAIAPNHPFLRGVKFPKIVEDAAGKKQKGLALENTEIYLNHVLTGPHTLLLGLRYEDPQTHEVRVQDTVAWTKPYGKGRISYLMPGHKASDYDNDVLATILSNAITTPIQMK